MPTEFFGYSSAGEVVQQLMERNRYGFPVLLDSYGRVRDRYRASGVPTTFVIGRSGKILWSSIADWSMPQPREALLRIIGVG